MTFLEFKRRAILMSAQRGNFQFIKARLVANEEVTVNTIMVDSVPFFVVWAGEGVFESVVEAFDAISASAEADILSGGTVDANVLSINEVITNMTLDFGLSVLNEVFSSLSMTFDNPLNMTITATAEQVATISTSLEAMSMEQVASAITELCYSKTQVLETVVLDLEMRTVEMFCGIRLVAGLIPALVTSPLIIDMGSYITKLFGAESEINTDASAVTLVGRTVVFFASNLISLLSGSVQIDKQPSNNLSSTLVGNVDASLVGSSKLSKGLLSDILFYLNATATLHRLVDAVLYDYESSTLDTVGTRTLENWFVKKI